MSWIAHPMLLWGLLLAAVPIIIHLLNRRRYRTVRWAAMDFLRAAFKKNQKRLRIENLLLLSGDHAKFGDQPDARPRRAPGDERPALPVPRFEADGALGDACRQAQTGERMAAGRGRRKRRKGRRLVPRERLRFDGAGGWRRHRSRSAP